MASLAHTTRRTQEPASTSPASASPERSQSAARFSIIPARAFDDTAMTPRLIQMLGLLGCYGDRDGWCYPSMRTLAARMHVTAAAVCKLIHQLDALGYLSITRRQRSDGGNTSNSYRLLFDPALPAERDARTLLTPEVNTPPVNSRSEHPVNTSGLHPVNSRSEHPVHSKRLTKRTHLNVPANVPANDGASTPTESTNDTSIPDTTPLPYTAWLRSDDGLAYLRTRGVDPHTRKTSQLLTAYRAWYHERGIHV